jgi:hypothetical protein
MTMHHFAIVRRPDQQNETYLYLDRDHQQECTRRIQSQEPQAHIVCISSITRPNNIVVDYPELYGRAH